jgi:hypothetical protein
MPIICADIVTWANAYDGPLFHAALMDAPYEMEFMGKGWDNTGVAFNPETWRAIARCLHPGAFLFVMAGTLNDDLISVAMRQAGLRKFHKMVYWGYGSGFPKATNIAAGIDAQQFRAWLKDHPAEAQLLKVARAAERQARKAGRTDNAKKLKVAAMAIESQLKTQAGMQPAVIGTKKHQPKFAAAELGYRKKDNGFNSKDRETFDVMGAATELAQTWLGHRYGGQAIKPAVESVLIFQKPYAGSPLQCITSSGAGALWIDGARVGSDVLVNGPTTPSNSSFNASFTNDYAGQIVTGRWPANLILSHSPACNGVCAPGCPVAALGAQSGESSSTGGKTNTGLRGQVYGDYSGDMLGQNAGGLGDTGTAARFFFNADYAAERLELADAIAYVAKASRSEREAGLDPRQTAIMRLLDDSDDTPEDFEGRAVYGKMHTIKRCPEHGTARQGNIYTCGCPMQYDHDFDVTTVSDGRETPIDNPYQRGETTRRNTHPTIKPIALARYLATLLLPPAAYGPRRLLIPFSGAGSEYVGADLAGWEEIAGVELGTDHCAIANARIAYWQQRKWELGDPARKLTVKAPAKVPQGQIDMFVESEA